ncbi:phosphoribosyltransferase family protein [Rhodoplanes sp. TEM]|uniref:Phosphoribosyltransferase family protein n=1 Tax=Rhodoplanes tepidamans TaxID=200616 RepID=A0ABT5J8R7_RHOTP|nr:MULTISPECIES: phosphoribosyltransferase family protein [Rhodoplanes]MDC7786054.1 phosphoribosyltransferase family protein [Rhodoplanes tepidamans]MDC7983805.1 phosphoribosyltransferase family protein [Rhodoplanes sp. TEM]MDQ0354897.1 putative phosphoribosyltransferase [Rhodoplanes tepidamans]
MFTDRRDAGRRLAAALRDLKNESPVVLALPRGGVPVAAEIAIALGAPLDLVVARKIGLPEQPELAMGAVVEGDPPIVLRNEDVIRSAGIDSTTFNAACAAERAEIARRRARYLGGRPRIEIAGRTAILVDDGLATGATARAALRAVRRRRPARLVLAVPVGAPETITAMRDEADAIVCLEEPEWMPAIGAFYRDFDQVADAEVIAALARVPAA